MSGEIVNIIPGDTLTAIKALADKSVHVCIYSPPYWALRQYTTPVYEGGDPDCQHKFGGHGSVTQTVYQSAGNPQPAAANRGNGRVCVKCGARRVDKELGAETVHDCFGWATGNDCGECYICHQRQVAQEVRRVLRNDGTLWIVIDDTRSGSGGAGGDYNKAGLKDGQPKYKGSGKSSGLKAKDLCGIPQSLALALRADGWYWRSEIIWAKGVSFFEDYAGSCMPEAVTDRPTDSHEYILMFSKKPQYYFDMEAIKEHEESERNLRTVWIIGTANTTYDHYATYPVALIEPIVKMSTSERGCCPVCAAPLKRVVERRGAKGRKRGNYDAAQDVPVNPMYRGGHHNDGLARNPEYITLGWQPTCKCNSTADPVPCAVLDVFSGYGTTGVVAKREARSYTGIELNEKHVKASEKRIASVISKDEQLSFRIDFGEE